MQIIGITGYIGHGKSTTASFIKSYIRDHKVRILPFAKPLKDMATKMGWDGKKDEKGRRLLQLLATDVCRNCIDPDYWVKKWEEEIFTFMKNDIVIADDVRFFNEVDIIRKIGGKMIKIENPNIESDKTHISEQNIDLIPSDIIMINDGTLDDLREKVEFAVRFMGIY